VLARRPALNSERKIGIGGRADFTRRPPCRS
jgi:hypothetical protein